MSLKFLYTFSVDREVKKEITEETPDGKLTKTITEKIPVKFGLRKPNRAIVDSGELFYGVQLSEAIKLGLMPRALLQKKFANDNGIFSDAQIEEHRKLSEKFVDLRNDIIKFNLLEEKDKTEEGKAKITEQLIEANNIQTRLAEYENAQNSLYEHTAENRAKYKTVLWYALFLSYIEEKGEFKPLFEGESFKDKLNFYDKIEEDNDPFFNEAIQKFSLFVTYYYHGKAVVEQDFKTLDEELSRSSKPEVEPEV